MWVAVRSCPFNIPDRAIFLIRRLLRTYACTVRRGGLKAITARFEKNLVHAEPFWEAYASGTGEPRT